MVNLVRQQGINQANIVSSLVSLSLAQSFNNHPQGDLKPFASALLALANVYPINTPVLTCHARRNMTDQPMSGFKSSFGLAVSSGGLVFAKRLSQLRRAASSFWVTVLLPTSLASAAACTSSPAPRWSGKVHRDVSHSSKLLDQATKSHSNRSTDSPETYPSSGGWCDAGLAC